MNVHQGAPLAVLALLLVLTLLSCGQSQQQNQGGGETVLPSAGQSDTAPPGDVPAPATQPPP